jgi:hypothetical protein
MARSGSWSRSHGKLTGVIAALGVGVAACAGAGSADASKSVGGGSFYTDPPVVKNLSCRAGCSETHSAVPAGSTVLVKSGGSLKVGGRNLSSVKKVIFLGGKSFGDEARATPTSVGSKSLTVKVPASATSGPIQLLDDALRKSKPSSVRIKLPVDQNANAVRARIVQVAESQIGESEHPPGSNCSKYGPCEAWCADFATWVWRQAGVSIDRIGLVRNLRLWGRDHGTWKPGYNNNPRPGDFVIFSDLHVGLVERASSNSITIIAGNTGTNNVARRGPSSPANGTSMGPAAITGYVSPVTRSGHRVSASAAYSLPRPTAAQMAAQDPQDHNPRLAAQER